MNSADLLTSLGRRSVGGIAKLLVAACVLGGLPSAGAQTVGLTGTWVSASSAERLVFSPDGFFRTCFGDGKKGNAALGHWKTLSPGRFAIEFTHSAATTCSGEPKPLHKYKASIVGQVMLAKGELSLFVGGEFPPEVFKPARGPASR